MAEATYYTIIYDIRYSASFVETLNGLEPEMTAKKQ